MQDSRSTISDLRARRVDFNAEGYVLSSLMYANSVDLVLRCQFCDLLCLDLHNDSFGMSFCLFALLNESQLNVFIGGYYLTRSGF